ncbi:hypothetical protein JL49_13180 [Pseudoalteromonas luteoviolacea]|nr:hypothetical protein JL49_13180 [Pseudoalteromonas luteoviolacea]
MSLFTQQQIENNWLYTQVMSDINELYIERGQPQELPDGAATTTTGNHNDSFWCGDKIGDWDGKEDAVAAKAEALLDDVYTGLSLYGNGGISHYYATPEWDEFVQAALEIIESWHEHGAFEQLCDSIDVEDLD